MDKTATQTKSFRLDADILQVLEMESARRGTSVNSMTNSILRKWVNFDRFVQDFGYIMISVHDFIRGLNVQEEATIKSLAAETGKRFPKDLILFTGQKNDLKTCLRFVESIFCDYMKWATYNTTSTEFEHVITLRHNYGPKWSLALEAVLQSMFESNTNSRPKFTVTDGTVLMVIEKNEIKDTTVSAGLKQQPIDSS